jgi:hypothetical protein
MTSKEEFQQLIWQAYNDLSPRDKEFIKKFKKDYEGELEWLKDN